MQTDLSLLTAFFAGLLTFLSPCILPLIPGYLSFLSGATLKTGKKHQAIYPALFFILGFSIIFILLGASATLLGKYLLQNLRILNKIAGIVLILFGLQIMGVLKFSFLNSEKRFHLKNGSKSPWSAILIGMAFAFGWSPCIGPLLAAILVLAGNQDTILKGIYLLSFYTLGLALPFLLTALLLEQFFGFFNKIKKYFQVIEITSGLLLILVGLNFIFSFWR